MQQLTLPLSAYRNSTASDDLALTGPTFEPYTDDPDQQQQSTTTPPDPDTHSPTHEDDDQQQRRRSRKRAEFVGTLFRKSIVGTSTLVANAFYYIYTWADRGSAVVLRERQLQRRDRYIRESGEFSGREGEIAI